MRIGMAKTRRLLTPVSYTQCLFRPRVEHRADNHEPRSDRALAHAEDEPHSKEATKVGARCVAAECDSPDEDVDAHPFTHREPLERKVLRVLEDEVAQVEYRAQPVVPKRGLC